MGMTQTQDMKIEEVRALPVLPLADVYPMLSGEEANDLAKSINSNGIREAVILFDGFLLDGRNRLAAAVKAGLETIPVRTFEGTIEEAEDLVIDLNEKRRHLSAGQRAYIAHQHREIVESRAKARQVEAGRLVGSGENAKLPSDLTGASESGDTRDVLASKHNVANSYVDGVKKLAQAAEETMVDPDTSDNVIATPRAQKAQQLLGQIKRGDVSMNGALTQFRGQPGQEITSDTDPEELFAKQSKDAEVKFIKAGQDILAMPGGEKRDRAWDSYMARFYRIEEFINENVQ